MRATAALDAFTRPSGSRIARLILPKPQYTGEFRMNIRFLTPTLHGMADYLAAAGLVTMPFILGIGSTAPLARWLAVGAGVGLVIYSLITDYPLGATPILPFRVHLVFDTLAAVVFALAPFVFGFHGLDAWYYWANSVAVFFVVGLSPTRNSAVPRMAHA
jgi:hypothetical protein